MQKRKKPVKTMAELRLLLTEALCDYQNGDMTGDELGNIGRISSVIVGTVKAEAAVALVAGVKKSIDFLPPSDGSTISIEKGLKNEFFEQERKLATS